ncbi:MAG: hypothetical protein WCP77_13060 [Roseococcus sp.]
MVPVCLALTSASAFATDNISIKYDVNGQTGTRSFSTIQQVMDAIQGRTFLPPSVRYSDASPASGQFSFRGLNGVATYLPNSTALRIQVPSTGLDRTFQETNRAESARAVQIFLEGSAGGSTLTSRISPKETIGFEAPFAYTNSGGAASYAGNGGLLYRCEVTEQWQLQASARLGGAGSFELAAASGLYGIGVVSRFRFPLPDSWQVTVVNGVNYVATFPVSSGSVAVNYNVANTVFRSGVIATRDLDYRVAGWRLAVSA